MHDDDTPTPPLTFSFGNLLIKNSHDTYRMIKEDSLKIQCEKKSI